VLTSHPLAGGAAHRAGLRVEGSTARAVGGCAVARALADVAGGT